MRVRLLEYAREFQTRAAGLAEEATAWIPADPSDYDREVRRRQAVLWRYAVDAGALLLHAAILGALGRLPRVETRVLQLRAELRAALESGELPHNYRGLGVATRSCDFFLVQMFEEACRLWPPAHKDWQTAYGTESETAAMFVRIMTEIAAELAAVGGEGLLTTPPST